MKDIEVLASKAQETKRDINIKLFLADLPESVRGLCSPDKDKYLILINENLKPEEQTAAFLHELLHIWHDDFKTAMPVGRLEQIRHEELTSILKTLETHGVLGDAPNKLHFGLSDKMRILQ